MDVKIFVTSTRPNLHILSSEIGFVEKNVLFRQMLVIRDELNSFEIVLNSAVISSYPIFNS